MINLKRALFLLLPFVIFACSSQENQNSDAQPVSDSNSMTESGEMTEARYVEQATFEDMSGNKVRVSDFKGKVVLIDFWETWCKPCLAIFPTMQKLQEEYPDDFVVLAVNPGFADTKEDAQNFISEHDYDFRYLLDSNDLNEKLNVQSIPFKVYLDAEGNFIKSDIGSYGENKDYQALKSVIEKHKLSSDGE